MFRSAVAQKRIRGRKRDDMMRAYLKATGQDPDAISKNKLVPKGGFVEDESSEDVSVSGETTEEEKQETTSPEESSTEEKKEDE
mgnify:FL=1